jgi:hypothetical protein
MNLQKFIPPKGKSKKFGDVKVSTVKIESKNAINTYTVEASSASQPEYMNQVGISPLHNVQHFAKRCVTIDPILLDEYFQTPRLTIIVPQQAQLTNKTMLGVWRLISSDANISCVVACK